MRALTSETYLSSQSCKAIATATCTRRENDTYWTADMLVGTNEGKEGGFCALAEGRLESVLCPVDVEKAENTEAAL